MDPLVRLFKSVANEKRIRIVEYLLRKKRAGIESIASDLMLPYKTVAWNLKILEKGGILCEVRWKGEALYGILRPERSFKGGGKRERSAAFAVVDIIRRRVR